jgi:hypothetical protein
VRREAKGHSPKANEFAASIRWSQKRGMEDPTMVKPQIASRNSSKLVAQINAGQLPACLEAFDALIVQHGSAAAAMSKAGEKTNVFTAARKTATFMGKMRIPLNRVRRIALFQQQTGEVRARVEVAMETPITDRAGKVTGVRKWTNIWDWAIVEATKPAPVVVPVATPVVANHPLPLPIVKGTCEACPEGMAAFAVEAKGRGLRAMCPACHSAAVADKVSFVEAVAI